MGSMVTLGTLRIRKRRRLVEVNSERRAKRIQREIKKRLGEDAVLLRTEIRPHERIMKETGKRQGRRAQETEEERKLRELPEVKAMMQEMIQQHWRTWPDRPVPALRGMTPRQAARDPEGRERLESLLLDFETRNQSKADGFLKVDTAKLRRELGLESPK